MIQTDFIWVSKVIATCENEFHIKSCENIINAFESKYYVTVLKEILQEQLRAKEISLNKIPVAETAGI